MTDRQHSYIASLADQAGLRDAETAIHQVTGMPRSKQSKRGVSSQQASQVIDTLKAQV